MTSFITRFAPSPTGFLHVGNVRTALINWLMTRKNKGKFILRIDDTDLQRSKLEYVEAIKEDLTWLGLNWDELFHQSDRLETYEAAKQKLIEEGRLYPCYETKEELDMKRKMALNRSLPPIYDRAALNLTEAEKSKLETEGKKPHYRFKLTDNTIEWNDLIRGKISFEAKNLSDPILIREDGSMTYMLCSALDDIDTNITHVIRGEDHISNTAIGIQLCEALGGNIPTFGHLSLLKGKEGFMSKREGGFDIRSIREQGIDPMTLVSLLSSLGSSESIEITSHIEEIITKFDISKFGRAPANYDFQDLERLNSKLISMLSYNEAKQKLPDIEIDEQFWEAVKGNLSKIDEIEEWHKICNAEIEPIIAEEDKELLHVAISLLPQEPWNESTWSNWTAKVKEKTGKTGKNLFMPLRKALSARESGPELKTLLPLLGYKKAAERLAGNIA